MLSELEKCLYEEFQEIRIWENRAKTLVIILYTELSRSENLIVESYLKAKFIKDLRIFALTSLNKIGVSMDGIKEYEAGF